MAKKTEWDFFDFFRSFKSAVSMEKLFFSFSGLFLAGLAYGVMVILGMFFQSDTAIQSLFVNLGVILAGIITLVTGAGIAKMVVSEEVNDEELFFGEAIDYVKKTAARVFTVPVAIGIIVAVLFLIKWVIDWVWVYTPGLGQFLGVLFYGFEYGYSFFILIFLLVSMLALFLYFAVLAKTESLGEAVKETLSTAASRLPKLIVYLAVACILSTVVSLVCSEIFFKTKAFNDKYFLKLQDKERKAEDRRWTKTQQAAFGYVKPLAKLARAEYRVFKEVGIPLTKYHPGRYVAERELDVKVSAGWWYPILGLILAFWWLVLASIAFAYPLSLWFTFGSMAYLTCQSPIEADDDFDAPNKDRTEETPANDAPADEKKEGQE